MSRSSQLLVRRQGSLGYAPFNATYYASSRSISPARLDDRVQRQFSSSALRSNITKDQFLDMTKNGTEYTEMLREAAAARSNRPSGATDHVLNAGLSAAEQANRLWVADRALKLSALGYFMNYCYNGYLFSGKKTSLAQLPHEDLDLLGEPLSAWAPAPFDKDSQLTIENIMVAMQGEGGPARTLGISKEMHIMKSRILAGIMPISDRGWNELQLDSVDNFHDACQHLSAVTNTFHYLNLDIVKKPLRETYNLIWDHLDRFDQALLARNGSSPTPVKTTDMWHEFVKDHFETVSNRSHQWVRSRLDRLNASIVDKMSNEWLDEPGVTIDGEQWRLANLMHDVHDNMAQADSSIFLPMDGYKGEPEPSQDDIEPNTEAYRQEPISFSANTLARKTDYYQRVKYLVRAQLWENRNGTMIHGIEDMTLGANRAHDQASKELRGEVKLEEQEPWVAHVNHQLDHDVTITWGYVIYRTCYDHSEEEWETFKERFERDISNWGSGLNHIEKVKEISKVEWRGAKDLCENSSDLGAVKE